MQLNKVIDKKDNNLSSVTPLFLVPYQEYDNSCQAKNINLNKYNDQNNIFNMQTNKSLQLKEHNFNNLRTVGLDKAFLPITTIKLNKTNPAKDFRLYLSKNDKKVKPKKIKGYSNVAKFKIAISEGKYNKNIRYKKKLSTSEHNNKSNHPLLYYFARSLPVSSTQKIYWTKIIKTSFFKENKSQAKSIYRLYNCYENNVLSSLMKYVYTIIPNNILIDDFKDLNFIEKWEYCQNSNQNTCKLPLRWTGNKSVNYFEPLVIRYHKDMSGRKVGIDGLCPYCKPFAYQKKSGFNEYFFNIRDLSYEAHLSRTHGVYQTGEEMSPPIFVKMQEKYMFVCMDCNRIKKLENNSLSSEEFIFEYYRHCVNHHYRRDLNSSNKTQY